MKASENKRGFKIEDGMVGCLGKRGKTGEKLGRNLPYVESKVQTSSWGWGEVGVPREFPGTEPKFS